MRSDVALINFWLSGVYFTTPSCVAVEASGYCMHHQLLYAPPVTVCTTSYCMHHQLLCAPPVFTYGNPVSADSVALSDRFLYHIVFTARYEPDFTQNSC